MAEKDELRSKMKFLTYIPKTKHKNETDLLQKLSTGKTLKV